MKCPRCGYENRDDALYCNLCQTIFKKRSPPAQPAPPRPPPPPPAAKQALDYRKIAEDFVAKSGPNDPFVGGFGVVLDYSPASLHAIDEFISFTWGTKGESPDKEGYAPTPGKTIIIMQFGCYFGEAVRRLLGGRWEPSPDQPDNPLWTSLAIKPDVRIFPIAKSFKRMKNGAEDAMSPLLFQLIQQAKLDVNAVIAEGFLRQADAFLTKSALPPARRLHFAREFSRIATSLNPKLTGPVLAKILERVNKADPKEVEEAMGYPPDVIDFEEESGRVARSRWSLAVALDYSTASIGV